MGLEFHRNPSQNLPSLPPGVRQRLGRLDGQGLRMAIVSARFNIRLVGPMLQSAVDALRLAGVAEENIEICWVPGSFEIPFALQRMLQNGSWDAAIACGVVIDGATQHAQHILSSLAQTLQALAVRHSLPVIDSVVGAPSLELAEARCLSGEESRGAYAARAAVECATLWKSSLEG